MPDHLGDDMRKVRPEEKEEEIKCLYRIILYKLFSIHNFFYINTCNFNE